MNAKTGKIEGMHREVNWKKNNARGRRNNKARKQGEKEREKQKILKREKIIRKQPKEKEQK